MSDIRIFDNRPCALGEGPLWHPTRQQLFWFDINARKMLTRTADGPGAWQFDEYFSAAGWVDRETLLLASETGLWRFDIESGQREKLIELEADNPVTRSNDGRADPFGGFWISTMGKNAEPGAGSIYRYFKGQIVPIIQGVTIPNSICLSPDGQRAYYTDTVIARIMVQPLDAQGWPIGPVELFADVGAEGLNPDGSVVDTEGYLWNAQWGASRVARYRPDGTFDRAIIFPAAHCSCPAFGGPNLNQLFLTTATEGLSANDLASTPLSGQTFVVKVDVRGLAEYSVRF